MPALIPSSPLRHLRVRGGPAPFLIGESLFQWRTTGRADAKRLATAGLIIGLAPLATHASVLVLALIVTKLLTAIARLEARASVTLGSACRHRPVGAAVR
jgi:hypothetical protein